MAHAPVDFMILGTPRSGTTLVQRLACELDGVRVPPETHFFRLFAPRLLRRRGFPLTGHALGEELRRFATLETSRGLDLDVTATAARLGGRADTVLELFGAIVRELAGEARVVGEKTPSHLRWWRQLTSGMPELRLVAVVRDPRAVVASYFDAWGPRPAAVLAERWALDQREVAAAWRALGDERCLVLRYEDVVRDPDAARQSLASLLGVPVRVGRTPGPLALAWETWKARASGPVTADGIDRWRSVLPGAIADEVAAVARREMEAYGYRAAERTAPVGARAQWLRYRYRCERALDGRRRALLVAGARFA
jgi:Sulfotransferase family